MMRVISRSTAMLAFALSVVTAKDTFVNSPHYAIWCVGNCDTDVKTVSYPGAVLMGGSDDVQEAFEWHIKNANRGDFVVLRASGQNDYNDWVYNISKSIGYELNSVTTILFKDRDAAAARPVLDIIRNAEAFFFAGGDQGVYVNYWTNTAVQSIVQSKLGSVTVGGTSAGLAIQGQWVYTAVADSAVSEEAMADPYYANMDFIVPSFLEIPFMRSLITDTHFRKRDRMGRMLTFMARIWKEKSIPAGGFVRGVGVDEKTALILNTTSGEVRATGSSSAYVCTAASRPEVCIPGTPLTFKNIDCVRLDAAQHHVYSFASFTGEGTKYQNNIIDGKINEEPYGPQ